MDSASLCLTPHGRLVLVSDSGAPQLDARPAERLQKAFARGSGHGLLLLGVDEVATTLPPVFTWWREFGARYVSALCTHNPKGRCTAQAKSRPTVPSMRELEEIALSAPPLTGAEYLTDPAVLLSLWQELDTAFHAELSESKCGVQDFLKRRNPAWNLVGRVHFNLAENRKDAGAPFAFLATYTTRLSTRSTKDQAKAQHLPLGQALREYAGAANKERLLSLLIPVQRAAEACPWLKAMVDAGEIFHPLRWSPGEALQLLKDVPQLEAAGVVVRMPAAWRGNRPPRPRVTGIVGGKPPSGIGKDALLDFHMAVTLDGETFDRCRKSGELLAKSDGLAAGAGALDRAKSGTPEAGNRPLPRSRARSARERPRLW